jgi:hypothetical protein
MIRFTLTHLSLLHHLVDCAVFFLRILGINASLKGLIMKKKSSSFAVKNDLHVDLTFHNVSATLLTEFAQKIVHPYYRGNLNAAIQDLIQKSLFEENFVLSHVTHVRVAQKKQIA